MPDSPSDPYDTLVADLRALGRSRPQPADGSEAAPGGLSSGTLDGLVAAVMGRLAGAPVPTKVPATVPTIVPTAEPRIGAEVPGRRGRWEQRALSALAARRRRVLIAVAVVLLGFLGVPGVRAAVLDWFGFDGVVVRIHSAPGKGVTSVPPPPTAGRSTSLDHARSLVRFQPVALTALGAPQGVEVSADRRLLSLSWTDPAHGTVRLDEFDGRLDYVFAKTAPKVQWTAVAGSPALWFDQPQAVVVLDAAGHPRTETARLAGHTLIWESTGTVLRLEGDLALEQALEIARSAEPLS